MTRQDQDALILGVIVAAVMTAFLVYFAVSLATQGIAPG